MIRYPGRLTHHTPGWVKSGSTFHIRISIDLQASPHLTDPRIGPVLLDSARFYHGRNRWNCRLLLLMPDHLHALLVFPNDRAMADIIAGWKGFHAKNAGLRWQGNYFDHRIRSQKELQEKAAYIRLNPVRKNLCAREEDWRWVISCDSENCATESQVRFSGDPENPSGGRVPP